MLAGGTASESEDNDADGAAGRPAGAVRRLCACACRTATPGCAQRVAAHVGRTADRPTLPGRSGERPGCPLDVVRRWRADRGGRWCPGPRDGGTARPPGPARFRPGSLAAEQGAARAPWSPAGCCAAELLQVPGARSRSTDDRDPDGAGGRDEDQADPTCFDVLDGAGRADDGAVACVGHEQMGPCANTRAHAPGLRPGRGQAHPTGQSNAARGEPGRVRKCCAPGGTQHADHSTGPPGVRRRRHLRPPAPGVSRQRAAGNSVCQMSTSAPVIGSAVSFGAPAAVRRTASPASRYLACSRFAPPRAM